MMRKLLLLGLVIAVVPVIAQVSGPEEPGQTEILVPEFILQVEELAIEQVDALLPQEAEQTIGQIALPLPEGDELAISDVSLDVPLPGATIPTTGQSSVFSTGRLGAGTSSHVVGELSLYKLGSDPQYRVRFAHEGVDGYQLEPAGTGYFLRSNILDARISAGEEPLRFSAEGGFSETERGLQGHSDYFSVNLREIAADMDVRYRPDPLITLNGRLAASSTARLQSTSGVGTAPRDQEFVVNPQISAATSVSIVGLSISSGYFLRFLADGSVPTMQDVEAMAQVTVDPSDSVSIGGEAGVVWDLESRLLYPWRVSFEATLAGSLDISVAGGYRYLRPTFNEQWNQTPLLAVGDSDGSPDLVGDGQWFAEVDALFSGFGGATVRSSAEYVVRSAAVDLQAYDTVADEYPFVQRTVQTVYPDFSFVWRPVTALQIEGGWRGAFIDTVAGEPIGMIHAAIRYADHGPLSASAEVSSELYPTPTMPDLSLSGAFAAGGGVEFVVEGVDVLSPLLAAGRASIGPTVNAANPFIEPGFRVSVFTRISL